jgi:hypothetical protein
MAGTKWVRQEIVPVRVTLPLTHPGTVGESVLRGAEAPLYAALARQWRSAGRMVPGQADPEWTGLVSRVPRLAVL